MKIPDKYLAILSKFQAALKSEGNTEIDKISLRDIRLAKAYLSADKDRPYYVHMLEYLQSRETKEKAASSGNLADKEDAIFISHISEEADIALALKDLLQSVFNNIPVFVSSDYESIESGEEWYDVIVDRARSAKIVMVLLSMQSINQPWINFEAGIGAGTNGKIIPIVGRNTSKREVPPPLSSRQIRDLRDSKAVEALLRDVAKTLQRQPPSGDWSAFMNEVGGIIRKLPYQGLYLEPYRVAGDKFYEIKFRIINDGTTDMNLMAVEGSVPASVLLQSWGLPRTIANLTKATGVDVDGVKRFVFRCNAYTGPIAPGRGHPNRLPEHMTPSMSPYEFSMLRFVLRTDLTDEELDQTIEYKVLAKDFPTETHTMTIREILKVKKAE